jgi:hypothetical protein
MNSPNICLKKPNYSVNLHKMKKKDLNIMMKKMRKRRRKSQRVKNHQIPKNQRRKKIRLLKIKIR